jgi:DNA-binding transcriptional MerR regulator
MEARIPTASPATTREDTPAEQAEERVVVRLPLVDEGRIRGRSLQALEPAATERLLQVGDLAKAVGKTVRAIHHYEELGLLKPDSRSKGRFRLYDASAVTRLRWIGKLSDLGMSLAQIRTVLSAWEDAPTAARAMSEVRATYLAKLAETRAQIAHLQELERELDASVRYLDTCNTCDLTSWDGSPPLETGAGSSHQNHSAHAHGHDSNGATCEACQLRERDAEPDLVAGIVAGG